MHQLFDSVHNSASHQFGVSLVQGLLPGGGHGHGHIYGDHSGHGYGDHGGHGEGLKAHGMEVLPSCLMITTTLK